MSETISPAPARTKPSPHPRAATEPEATETAATEASESQSAEDSTEESTVEPAPESTPEPGGESTVESPSRLARFFRPRLLAAVVVVLIVAAGAVFAWLRIDSLTGLESARADAIDAGKRYAAMISTYDYRNAGANLDEVVSHSTDKFATEYRGSAATLTGLIQQYQASSQANVLDVAVESADTGHAVVLAFVDQTVRNTNLKDPRIDRSRMKLTLARSGGEWKLDEIALQ